MKDININTISEGQVKSDDELDHETRAWWADEVDTAINKWWKEVPIVTRAAYKEDLEVTPLGKVVLDLPYGLALMLANQYGWECFHDDDFIAYTQKAVGQTFLRSI